MAVFEVFTGMPGVSVEKIARHRTVTADGFLEMQPGGIILDYTKMRDTDNPDLDPLRLRAGIMIGKATTGGKYANSVIGALQAAVAAAATTLTLTALQAGEIVRRQGASGTFKLTGPPAAAGTVATQTVTYSAVNTTTGVVTCTALSAAAVAGSFAQPTDGTEAMITFLPDGWEVVLPTTGDLPLPNLPIGGYIDGAKLLPYPVDVSIRAWVKLQLRAPIGPGRFTFVDSF